MLIKLHRFFRVVTLALALLFVSTYLQAQDFEEFELFEDDEIQDEYTLLDSDIVQIKNIMVNIDGTIYKNPDDATERAKHIPNFSILYGTITARREQTHSKSRLDHQIKYWILRLNESPYYGNANIEIINLDNTEQHQGAYPINLVISVTLDHGYSYFGGNAFAGFGIKHLNGLQSTFYAGGNRLEYSFEHDSIVIKDTKKTYSSLILATEGRIFGYWDFIPSWSNAFIYGGDAYIGIKPLLSTTISLGTSLFAYSNIFDNYTDEQNKHVGIPNYQNSALSNQLHSKIDFRIPLNKVDWYTSEISVSLPFMAGLWNGVDDTFSPYFSSGLFARKRFAYKLGIPQAITFTGSYVNSILIFDTAPFHAKANIRHGFYNSYGLRTPYGRRGTGYSEKLYVGGHGGALNLEYGLIVLNKRSFALETYVFYDTGSVSNSYDDWVNNIRHTVGPGVSLFIGSPINMTFKLSTGIGGNAINGYDDGNNVSIDFSAEIN